MLHDGSDRGISDKISILNCDDPWISDTPYSQYKQNAIASDIRGFSDLLTDLVDIISDILDYLYD